MNSKSIHIDHCSHSSFADLSSQPLVNQHLFNQPISLLVTVCKRVSAFFIRSELEKAQANYRLKQQHQSPQKQDILSSMPIETKLSLGMYRLMD